MIAGILNTPVCIGRFTLFLTNLRRHGILEQKESTTLIGVPDEGFLDIILCQMWCLAMALELIVASVDGPAVLVGRMPYLGPVPAAALGTLDFYLPHSLVICLISC